MFLRAGGYATLIGPDGTQKADTFTCVHCNKLVQVNAGARPEDVGGGCRRCMEPGNPLKGLICKACVAKGTCTPFEHWLEKVEANAEKQRAVAGYFACAG